MDQSTKERANTVAWLAICTFSQIQLPLISLHREKKPFSSRKEEREEKERKKIERDKDRMFF